MVIILYNDIKGILLNYIESYIRSYIRSYNKYINEDTDAFTKRSSFIDIKNNLFSLSRSNSYTYAKFKQTGIWIRGGRNFNFKTHISYDLDSIADELAMHLGKVNLN